MIHFYRSRFPSHLLLTFLCLAPAIACSEGADDPGLPGSGTGGLSGTGGSDAGTGSTSSGGMAPLGSSGGGPSGSGGSVETGTGGDVIGGGGAPSSGGSVGTGGMPAMGSGGDGSGGENSNCQGYVGITYDDGPVNTDAFVNALEDAGLVPVTFFVNGSLISGKPGAIAKMLTVGEVQSHGYTHDDMGGFSVDQVKMQLQQNNDAIVAAGAPKPTIFRPPYGSSSANVMSAASQLDMIVITWDVDSQDWNGASSDAIVAANEKMTNGQVILMHENQNASLAAIPQIAAALEAKGMCPGKLDPTTGKAIAP